MISLLVRTTSGFDRGLLFTGLLSTLDLHGNRVTRYELTETEKMLFGSAMTYLTGFADLEKKNVVPITKMRLGFLKI